MTPAKKPSCHDNANDKNSTPSQALSSSATTTPSKPLAATTTAAAANSSSLPPHPHLPPPPPPYYGGYGMSPPFDTSSFGIMSPQPPGPGSPSPQQYHHLLQHAMPLSSPFPSGATPSSMSRRGGKTPGSTPIKAMAAAATTSPFQHHPAYMGGSPPPGAFQHQYHKYFSPTTMPSDAQRVSDRQAHCSEISYMADAMVDDGNNKNEDGAAQQLFSANDSDNHAVDAAATHEGASGAAEDSATKTIRMPPTPPYPYHHHSHHAYPPPHPHMGMWNFHHLQQQQQQQQFAQQQRAARSFAASMGSMGNNSRPRMSKKYAAATSAEKYYAAAAAAEGGGLAAPLSQGTTPLKVDFVATRKHSDAGCTCKRTRCLKLYCQCFAAKQYCADNCRCVDCHNSTAHADTRREAMRMILLRNSKAFDTKFEQEATPVMVVSEAAAAVMPLQQQFIDEQDDQIVAAASSDSASTGRATSMENPPEIGGANQQQTLQTTTVPKLLAHKTGCKCRKSGCMKKYCECYAGGVKCSNACRCLGCKNTGPAILDNRKRDGGAPDLTSKADILPMPLQHYYQPPMMRYAMGHNAHHHHPLPPLHPMMYHPSPPPGMSPTTPLTVASLNSNTSSTRNGTNENDPGTARVKTYSATKASSATKKRPEPWLAAHNLTIMKQGTPSPPRNDDSNSEAKRHASDDKDMNSLPSLEPTSSDEAASPTTQDGEVAGVNSLLMAAMAMTGDYDVESSTLSTPLSNLKRPKNPNSAAKGASPKRLCMETPNRRERATTNNPLLSPIVAYQHQHAEV